MTKRQRIQYIDYAKALAIFFVVVGHATLCPNNLRQWIYAFHMPLFFSFYGIVWKTENAKCGRKGCLKKIRRLIVPYLFWVSLYTLVNGALSGGVNYRHILLNLYGSQAVLKQTSSLTSLWYLPCLFIASSLFDLTAGFIEGRTNFRVRLILRGGLLAATYGTSLLLSKALPLPLGYPWNFNVAFMSVFFMEIGYLCKPLFESIQHGTVSIKVVVCVISFAILTVTYRLNLPYLAINNVDMVSSNYGHFLLFPLGAMAGILGTVVLGTLIAKLGDIKILSFIGQNTMAVLFLHKPIVVDVTWGMSKPGIVRLAITLVLSVAVTAMASGCAVLLNRWFPFCVGREKSPQRSQKQDKLSRMEGKR